MSYNKNNQPTAIKVKMFLVRQIDTVVTEFLVEAENKKEAEYKWANCELTEREQPKTTDRVIEVEEVI